MKLIKIFTNGYIPGIKVTGPITEDKSLLVSDEKCTLLQFSKVSMFLEGSFKDEFLNESKTDVFCNEVKNQLNDGLLIKTTVTAVPTKTEIEDGEFAIYNNKGIKIVYVNTKDTIEEYISLNPIPYKQIENFGLNGTYPWERGYEGVVTTAKGGFAKGDSLKGMSIVEIIEKLLCGSEDPSVNYLEDINDIYTEINTIIANAESTYTNESVVLYQTSMVGVGGSTTSPIASSPVYVCNAGIQEIADQGYPETSVIAQNEYKELYTALNTANEAAKESLITA